MDIVLTIPKRNYERNDKKLGDIIDEGSCMFWVMTRIPKELEVGDRVHFVRHGRVEYHMRLFETRERATEICATTGKVWQGRYIMYMDDLQWHDTVIMARGFQGFRYKWWEDADVPDS